MKQKKKSSNVRDSLYAALDNRYFSETKDTLCFCRLVEYKEGRKTKEKFEFDHFIETKDIREDRIMKYWALRDELRPFKGLMVDWLNFKVKNTIANRNFLFKFLPPLEESILKKNNTQVMSYTHKERIIKLDYHFEEIEEIVCKISSQGLSLIFNPTENYTPQMSITEFIEWIFDNDELKKTKEHGWIHTGITRIDIALDDYIGYIDMDYLEHKINTNCYVTRLGGYMPLARKDLQRRKFQGKSLNFGDRACPTFIRYYDKLAMRKDLKLEINPRIQTWNRMELELKSNIANLFTFRYITDKSFSPYQAILAMLRITAEPIAQDDKNKQRFETDFFYEKFLKGTKKPERLKVPQIFYDFKNLERYIEKTCSGSLDTYVRIEGIEKLVKVLDERKEVTNKNPKHVSLLETHGDRYEGDDLYDEILTNSKVSKLNRKKKKDEDNE